MTDRYYPKGLVPTYKYESTYNLMNQMETHPRSNFPPGYSGHEHGKTAKFGYGTPAADPLPRPPIDPEDPLVNFNIGKYVPAEPLASAPLSLNKLPPKEEALPKFFTHVKPFEADEGYTAAKGGETEDRLTFTTKTSAYLRSKDAAKTISVGKDQPYTPATYGRGTGFNADSPYCSFFPGGKLQQHTTTADAFPAPVMPRKGLACLSYTRELAAK